MADTLVLLPTLPEDYAAFKPVDRRHVRLNLRLADGSLEWLPYGYLLRVIVSADERGLTLLYTFLSVFITGRNLHDVGEAIAAEHCEFIAAYDAKRWPKPKDSSAAFIERIEIIADRSPDRALHEREEEQA